MRLSNALVVAATLAQSLSASAIPSTDEPALETRTQHESQFSDRSIEREQEELWKRKGGGGGGGRGGGSSGGGRGSGSSSSGGGSSSGGRGSSGSNAGGRTTTGSGPRPAYGPGGAFYPGGARVPYRPGARSPGGIAPYVVAGAGLGFLGGAYLAGGAYYMYPYNHQYYYHNATTDRNETKPVICACREDGVCSCEDNGDQEYFASIIGDGSYDGLNKSIVDVVRNETDGRTYIYINGTLPNGTTAAGGTEDPNAGAGLRALVRVAGWWPVVTTALVLACTL
ncbi:hypothetical protein DL764_004795 [Monosporascus ibericus]|uniref:DUF7732 domain-containing protein n=1 Tax=Monosporascus ibericus TaxID=155417 RepID=A0A4V1XAU0_9PEZI|nr:hypothetical protein DL764_004795 [Monosporascus ibericus]